MLLSLHPRQLTLLLISWLLVAAAGDPDVREGTSDVGGRTSDVGGGTSDVGGGASDVREELQRAARALGADSRMLYGFPTGSSISLTLTLLTPIIEHGPVSGVLNITYPAIAVPIDRPAQQRSYIQGQRSRGDDLRDIYRHLEQTIDDFGYPGAACLQRTLCEAAGRRGDSPLLSRVLQLITHDEPGAFSPEDYTANEMTEARSRGLSDPSTCRRVYSDCPGSVFDFLDAAYLL